MKKFDNLVPGIGLCIIIAIPAWMLGKMIPVVGSPIFSILIGMMIAKIIKSWAKYDSGIGFSSKKILQTAVVLLGFGMNLSEIAKVGVMILINKLVSRKERRSEKND